MTINAADICFVLSAALRGTGPATRRQERAIREGLQGRYTVVRVNKDGGLPLRAEVSAFNSANDLDKAREMLGRIGAANPSTLFVLVDRIQKVTV